MQVTDDRLLTMHRSDHVIGITRRENVLFSRDLERARTTRRLPGLLIVISNSQSYDSLLTINIRADATDRTDIDTRAFSILIK